MKEPIDDSTHLRVEPAQRPIEPTDLPLPATDDQLPADQTPGDQLPGDQLPGDPAAAPADSAQAPVTSKGSPVDPSIQFEELGVPEEGTELPGRGDKPDTTDEAHIINVYGHRLS